MRPVSRRTVSSSPGRRAALTSAALPIRLPRMTPPTIAAVLPPPLPIPLPAQPPNARIGEAVPRDVRELYDKGLQYLVKTQADSGEWTGGQSLVGEAPRT